MTRKPILPQCPALTLDKQFHECMEIYMRCVGYKNEAFANGNHDEEHRLRGEQQRAADKVCMELKRLILSQGKKT